MKYLKYDQLSFRETPSFCSQNVKCQVPKLREFQSKIIIWILYTFFIPLVEWFSGRIVSISQECSLSTYDSPIDFSSILAIISLASSLPLSLPAGPQLNLKVESLSEGYFPQSNWINMMRASVFVSIFKLEVELESTFHSSGNPYPFTNPHFMSYPMDMPWIWHGYYNIRYIF